MELRGNYIRKYETATERDTDRWSENYYEPWVSAVVENGDVDYNKDEYERLLGTPLTVEALEDGTIQCVYDGPSDDYVYSVKYSINGGEMVVCEPTMNNPVEIDVSEGDKVSFYYNGSDYYYYEESSSNEYFFHILINNASAKLYGNIMSLCDDENFENYTTIDYDSQFKLLFSNSSSLVDASDLILPATTLTKNCYDSMFDGCTSLVQAPELPATTLTNYCYYYMFYHCTSLTTALELPATTLADYCYYNMFYNCTSLTTAPELPATTLANYCYGGMFQGCTSLTTAPALPATALTVYCYYYMFYGCTGLTTAPELPATTLANYCYYYMFRNCSNLNYIKCLATNKSASSCTTNWVNGVSSTGTFVKNSNMTGWTTGVNGIPSGWTVQDAS